MKVRNAIRKSAGIAAVVLMGVGVAGACDLQHNGVVGAWWVNCNLTVDPKAPKLEATVISGTVRTRWFKLPDLTIRRYRYTTSATRSRSRPRCATSAIKRPSPPRSA